MHKLCIVLSNEIKSHLDVWKLIHTLQSYILILCSEMESDDLCFQYEINVLTLEVLS